MLKQIATVGITVLTLTGCVTPTNSQTLSVQLASNKVSMIKPSETPQLDMLEVSRLGSNSLKIQSMVSKLKKHVGKTWYVFSGSTPSGWDCSGMTMWAYEQIGIPLEHRASKQQNSGTKVSQPKIGDIVVFKYKGYQSAYHVGIYIGVDKMIHAGGGKGDRTSVESISTFAGKYSKVSYVRMLDTP